MKLKSGISVIYTAGIKRRIKKEGDGFLAKHFSRRELAYCKKKRYAAEHLAARLAAKEAFLEMLSLPVHSANLSKIEVIRHPSGRPSLRVHKSLFKKSAWRGAEIHLSLAHEREAAIAFVLLSKSV